MQLGDPAYSLGYKSATTYTKNSDQVTSNQQTATPPSSLAVGQTSTTSATRSVITFDGTNYKDDGIVYNQYGKRAYTMKLGGKMLITQGKTATASSGIAGAPVDNNSTTAWEPTDSTHMWMLDLGMPYVIAKCHLGFRSTATDAERSHIIVEASNDISFATGVETIGPVIADTPAAILGWNSSGSNLSHAFRYIRVRKTVATEPFAIQDFMAYGLPAFTSNIAVRKHVTAGSVSDNGNTDPMDDDIASYCNDGVSTTAWKSAVTTTQDVNKQRVIIDLGYKRFLSRFELDLDGTVGSDWLRQNFIIEAADDAGFTTGVVTLAKHETPAVTNVTGGPTWYGNCDPLRTSTAYRYLRVRKLTDTVAAYASRPFLLT